MVGDTTGLPKTAVACLQGQSLTTESCERRNGNIPEVECDTVAESVLIQQTEDQESGVADPEEVGRDHNARPAEPSGILNFTLDSF